MEGNYNNGIELSRNEKEISATPEISNYINYKTIAGSRID